MSVTITDPLDYGSFPYDEGWTATANIDNDDAVDGVLMDYSTSPPSVYPSAGPSCSGGPDSDGLYNWQVPFGDTTGISQGDYLLIYCYDAEISGDGATVTDTASQNGGAYGKKAPPSAIHIAPPALGADKKLQGTVQLPAGSKGGVFLVLMNRNGDIRKHTRWIHHCALQDLGGGAPLNYTFQNIDDTIWTHIHVVAVTYRHQSSSPAVYQYKPPLPKPHQHKQSGLKQDGGNGEAQSSKQPASLTPTSSNDR